MTAVFPDVLVARGTPGLPERFFDRFVFNLHGVGAPDPSDPRVIFGLGVFPARDVIDGFAIVVTGGEQRNLRLSDELSATRVTVTGGTLGPLSWRTPTAPSRRSRICSSQAGTRARSGSTAASCASTAGTASATAPGACATMAGEQGLHLWVQAQFPDRSIGFLTAESRGHERLLLEGAVMHEDGRLDPVTDVRHDLSFDDGLDLRGGFLEVTTRDGALYRIAADAAARGGYMSGGGYGGQHGRPMGRGHFEHDVYPLDGSVSPRVLDSALTDRLAAFTWDRAPGRGIFEFALTRSPWYAYQPTLS